jgi:hypothetical protein
MGICYTVGNVEVLFLEGGGRMKTGHWIAVFVVLLALCAGASFLLLTGNEPADTVEVWSDGVLLAVLDLNVPRELVVESTYGTNVVTVRDGAVAVTYADCPDGYCMKRGFCDGGVEIVCLPNRLVLRFVGEQAIDGVVG